MLRFLHLSDIHFRPSPGDSRHDVDLAVRDDLLSDLRTLRDAIWPIDAVLVVGDLSARGKEAEFHLAREFLDEACAIVGCDPRAVACVPGNHDVDRDAHGLLHEGLRRLLRTEPAGEVGARLSAAFADEPAAELLHAPFEAYNRFALPLGWAVTARHPIPDGWQLDLGDRTLRIMGVNSALISDATDAHEHDDRRVALGTPQLAQLADDAGRVTLLMCHHPSRWLRDRDYVAPWLARPHILLTGHEHELGIVVHPDGQSVEIASGAVNPAWNDQAWQPAYNVFELDVEEGKLVIGIRARCYGKNRTGFGADDRWPEGKTIRIPLQPDRTPAPEVAGVPVSKSSPMESDEREMIYSIFDTSPDIREQAARELRLLVAGQRLGTTDQEAALLERARAAGRLRDLAKRLGYDASDS